MTAPSILGAQFDADLSAQFARRQRLRIRARPKISEPHLDDRLAAKAQHRPRARTVDLKSPIRTNPDFAIGHADVPQATGCNAPGGAAARGAMKRLAIEQAKAIRRPDITEIFNGLN
jgi:hypothetical protein